MSSLVEELQRDALNERVSVSSLLRKAFVVASKLNLKKFRKWAESELKGYTGKTIPEYRIMRGELKVLNPYHGYVPFIVRNSEVLDIVTTHRERGAIGPIEDMLKESHKQPDGEIVVHFPPNVQMTLMRGMTPIRLPPTLHLAKIQMSRVLDAVRNTILEWSLKLEADGIVGDGISFSTDEKKIASRKESDLGPPITIINVGNMQNSTIHQTH